MTECNVLTHHQPGLIWVKQGLVVACHYCCVFQYTQMAVVVDTKMMDYVYFTSVVSLLVRRASRKELDKLNCRENNTNKHKKVNYLL